MSSSGSNNAAIEEVLPVAVDQSVSEERVVFPTQPFGQELTRVAVSRDFESVAAQTSRLQIFFGPRVLSLSDLLVMEDAFVAEVSVAGTNLRHSLLTNRAEEGGQTVVVVLAPLFEWVVMAAGTLDPRAEEELCGVFTCSLTSSTSRYQTTAGFVDASPEAVITSATNWSYGLFS